MFAPLLGLIGFIGACRLDTRSECLAAMADARIQSVSNVRSLRNPTPPEEFLTRPVKSPPRL